MSSQITIAAICGGVLENLRVFLLLRPVYMRRFALQQIRGCLSHDLTNKSFKENYFSNIDEIL